MNCHLQSVIMQRSSELCSCAVKSEPHCVFVVDRILCHYSYRREGNPSFWQLSASCCWPYVHAMTASKPLCLGDRLSPINSNEPQTGWSPRQQTTVTLLPYSLWNFFNLCSGFWLRVLSSFSLLCSPRAFVFFSFLTSLFLLLIGFLDVSFSPFFTQLWPSLRSVLQMGFLLFRCL